MFEIESMSQKAAECIATWQYAPPYDIYSFSNNEAEINELLNGLHFSVYNDDFGQQFTNEPCGFIAIGWSAQIQDPKLREIYDDESYTDLAFGLHPELCGKGYGATFIQAAIQFIRELFEEDAIRLTVDIKNLRAYSLYKKIGFKDFYEFETTCIDALKNESLCMKIMVLE